MKMLRDGKGWTEVEDHRIQPLKKRRWNPDDDDATSKSTH